MSFEDETDRRRKPESSQASETHDLPQTKKKKRGPNAEVGQALRSAYRQAVEEDIPPELLDLLGKLG